MNQVQKAHLFWKILAFWGVFILLYFAYKFFPVFPLSIISGVVESNFQHFKAGFYSYLIVSLIEYAWNRRKIVNHESFLFSRLAATIFLPWIIFLLWYLAPALIGRWPNNTYEIVYANLIIVMVGVCAVILESGLAGAAYTRPSKVILTGLFLASLLLYTMFTYNLPWADIFAEPDWR